MLILHLFPFHTTVSPKPKYNRQHVIQFLKEHDVGVKDTYLNEVMTSVKVGSLTGKTPKHHPVKTSPDPYWLSVRHLCCSSQSKHHFALIGL